MSELPPAETLPHEGNPPASGWMLWVIESPLCIRTMFPTWTAALGAENADMPAWDEPAAIVIVEFGGVPPPPPPPLLLLPPLHPERSAIPESRTATGTMVFMYSLPCRRSLWFEPTPRPGPVLASAERD